MEKLDPKRRHLAAQEITTTPNRKYKSGGVSSVTLPKGFSASTSTELAAQLIDESRRRIRPLPGARSGGREPAMVQFLAVASRRSGRICRRDAPAIGR